MSYYFPIGGGSSISLLNISHSILATTASVPSSANLSVLTASYASTVLNTPPAGTNGANQSPELCGPSTISGSRGVAGPTGSRGADNTTCPPGTIECTSLNASLPQLNLLRPSGSQFSKVCMEIPPGCTALTAVCPDLLPSASVTSTYPSIP